MKILIIFIFIIISLVNATPQLKNGQLDNDIIYFILVDRFHDGNKANNVPTWAFPKDTPYDESNRYWLEKMYYKNSALENSANLDTYWGGDLQGVIDRLDYLSDLGVTVLWLSPIFENVNGFHYGNGMTAYHGYWTKDFKRLEEHFVNPPGENQTVEDVISDAPILKELIDRAHDLNMKVILDLSLNHTSPAPLDLVTGDKKYFLELGALYDDGLFVTLACTLENGKTCLETYDNSGIFNFPVFAVDWKNPDTYVKGSIHGALADFNQMNGFVQNYFREAMLKWLSYGVDGFRIDAIKHIYPQYLKQLENELIEIKNDIIIIGEYFQGGNFEDGLNNKIGNSIKWLKSMDHTTMFDFSYAEATRDFFTKKRNNTGTPYFLEAILNEDHEMNKTGDKTNDLVTFINNHDIPRMMSLKESSTHAYIAALKFMFFSRGVPTLYYGDEIAFALPYDKKYKNVDGEIGGVPFNRIMMDWNKLNEQKYKTILETVKILIKFRKENSVLRWGKTEFIRAKNLINLIQGTSYLAMKREIVGQRAYYFFSHEKRQYLEFDVELADGKYSDIVDGKECTVKNGVLRWENVKPYDVLLLSGSF